MKFHVEFTGIVEIDAENLLFAKEEFERLRTSCAPVNDLTIEPKAFIQAENDSTFTVLGICDICQLSIINGEDYQIDGDIMEHTECLEESED